MARSTCTSAIPEIPVAAVEQPAWSAGPLGEGVVATSAEPITLLLGAPVRDTDGRRLGRICTLGLGIGAQQLTAVGTERVLYPASAVVEADPRGGVVVDPNRRARIVVSREITPTTRAWSTDDTDFRVAGLVADSRDRRIRRLAVRRHRWSPLLHLPWTVVHAEPDGLALEMIWRQAPDHPSAGQAEVGRQAPSGAGPHALTTGRL
jgi:hypothetical protein